MVDVKSDTYTVQVDAWIWSTKNPWWVRGSTREFKFAHRDGSVDENEGYRRLAAYHFRRAHKELLEYEKSREAYKAFLCGDDTGIAFAVATSKLGTMRKTREQILRVYLKFVNRIINRDDVHLALREPVVAGREYGYWGRDGFWVTTSEVQS